MTHIDIATEDALSEAVAVKLVGRFTNLTISNKFRRGGNGYLRSRLSNFFQIAQRTPVLLITDLDNQACASMLLEDWIAGIRMPIPANMLFRVAVREIESWILADHEATSRLLGVRNLPQNPDDLADPKRELIRMAERANRDVRQDLVVKQGAVASQGLGYNARLSNFVEGEWCPERACARSESLRRCCYRLQAL